MGAEPPLGPDGDQEGDAGAQLVPTTCLLGGAGRLLGPDSGQVGGSGVSLSSAIVLLGTGGLLLGQHTLRYCPYPDPQVSPADMKSLRFLKA